MSGDEFVSITGVLLAVNAGLLGVSASLLSLVPALLGAFDHSRAAFVQNEVAKKRLEGGLNLMRATIVLFAAGSCLGIVSFFYRPAYMLYLAGVSTGIGLLLITTAAIQLARISRFVVLGGSV